MMYLVYSLGSNQYNIRIIHSLYLLWVFEPVLDESHVNHDHVLVSHPLGRVLEFRFEALLRSLSVCTQHIGSVSPAERILSGFKSVLPQSDAWRENSHTQILHRLSASECDT